MAQIEYLLGSVAIMQELYPPPELAINPVLNYKNQNVYLRTYRDVIRHYTESSLDADGFCDFQVTVTEDEGVYRIGITAADTIEPQSASQNLLLRFAERHALLMSPAAAYKAVAGMNLMKQLNVWNPMEGFPVDRGGKCIWNLYPPLGLNIIGQRGMLLMHYPPIQCIQQGTSLNCMTMDRWNTLLGAVGIPKEEISFYRTVVDVNPVACPGSGESEYPNDYLPIMMASGFFTGPPAERDYIRSMLELYVAPPGGGGQKYTLPLLVCGSPLYDPQAPGWFRVTYKDQMPVNSEGTPVTNVLQAGSIKIRPDSKRATPYLCANHMIAAGVTGTCQGDLTKIPNIRVYEAQDLAAASFLYEYAKDPDLDPDVARSRACMRWFGNPTGEGAPNPPVPQDNLIICAMAQMDLFFVDKPLPHPLYTFEQGMERCRKANNGDNPCCPPIEPPPRPA